MGEFKDKKAVRDETPIIAALTSPSGGGKTLSALRIATGLKEIVRGEIFLIDTEGGRSLHYAPQEGEQASPEEPTYDFRIVPFSPPYSSLRYLEAINHCIAQGAGIIIIDSISYEHEGDGGYLQFHEEQVDKLMRQGFTNLEKAQWPAWKVPSQNRQKLLQRIRTCGKHFIFCFRAKDKMALQKVKGKDGKDKNEMVRLGWVPVGGMDFIFETQLSLVFPPMGEGVPILDSEKLTAEQLINFKMEKQFRKYFKKPEQLTEEHGRSLGLWSTGGKHITVEEAKERAVEQAATIPQEIKTPEVPTGPDQSVPCETCVGSSPRCKACNVIMVWRSAEYNEQYRRVVHGRWACPRRCKDPDDKRRLTNILGTDWHAILCSSLEQKNAMSVPDIPASAAGLVDNKFMDRIIATADDKKVDFAALNSYLRRENALPDLIERRLREVQTIQPWLLKVELDKTSNEGGQG